MAVQFKTYDDFSGGRNTAVHARKIRANEFVDLQNLVNDDPVGELRSCGQNSVVADPPATNAATLTPGYGLYYFEADHNLAGAAASQPIIACADETEEEILLIQYTGGAWPAAAAGQIDLGGTAGMKAVFHDVDEALRVADANFGAANAPKWYGYINRTHFPALTAVNNVTGWHEEANTLAAPTELLVAEGGGAAYPAGAGTGLAIDVTDPTPPVGTWTVITYQCALSFIYDGNQESLLYIPAANNTFAIDALNDSLSIDVYAKGDYGDRVSGMRVYARQNGTNEEWILLVDIDLNQGCRTSLSGEYTAWTDPVLANEADCLNLISIDPNVETYRGLNGYDPDEVSIDIGQTGDGWVAAVIAMRRCFWFGAERTNKDGKQERMRDSIFYSPINRFDVAPVSFKLNVIKGDAEKWVTAVEYEGKLLCFKEHTLYILDISSPNPSLWRVAKKIKHMGVGNPASVCKAAHGIVWVAQDKNAVFLYDGVRVVPLSTPKFSYTNAEAIFGDAYHTLIGYDPIRDRLFFKELTASSGYVYNFRTRSWWYASNLWSGYTSSTNYVTLGDGTLLFGDTNGAVIRFVEWADNAVAATSAMFVLRDDVFGYPGIQKEIRAVTITYKSSVLQTDAVNYYINGAVAGSTVLGNLSAKAVWSIVTFTPSPFTCQSLQLYVYADTSGTVNFADITVEYRLIPTARLAST